MIPRYSRPEMAKIWTDESKMQKWLDVELAALDALAERGYIPKNIPPKVRKKASFSVKRVLKIEEKTRHDVIAFLTDVSNQVGPEARFVHFGMTSSDVLDTGLALQLKEASEILIHDLGEFLKELKKQAKSHKYTLMAGRSHGVHAEPVTFGLKMALFYSEFQRNLERMKAATDRISYGKISGAVGTFANVDPEVEELVCKKLGLKPALISTQVVQRDRHAEYVSTLAIIAASLEKLAVEIRGLQRTEIGEAMEPFRKGQKGSSAMPHKRNPIICERVTGLARVIRANAMAAIENVALWHERDISHSSVERVILPDSTILIDYMLSLMTRVIKDIVVNEDKMRENLNLSRGMVFSQGILLRLVQKGLTREQSYKMVQAAAREVWDKDTTFEKTVKACKKIRRYLGPKELDEAFNYDYHIRNVDKIFKRLSI